MVKKEIVVVSERDRDIFGESFILIAGGLGALGIEDLLVANWWGLLKIGIAFLIISLASSIIRKKSDTKK